MNQKRSVLILTETSTTLNDLVLTTTVASAGSDRLVSDAVTAVVSWIVFLLCELLAIFGTVANIINIICFVKQGLKDPINVSFLGLSLSDLGSVAFLLWSCICFIPAFQESDVPFDPIEMQYMTTAWPHMVCTRVTSWITALITLERCLCIKMPLKVKTLITSRRVTITIVCVFILNVSSVIPIYCVTSLAWGFAPDRNKTMLRVVFTKDKALVESISYSIINVFSPFASFGIVIVATIALVLQLRSKAKWRLKCTAPQKADAMLERDQKVAKMVVMISAVFIACYIPLCCMFIAMIVEPKIGMGGEDSNVGVILGGLSVLCEDANSAMNIFIYYHMSSKYKHVFRKLFRLKG